MALMGEMKKLTIGDKTYTIGGGTITSVGISNASNGGLTITGSPITSSGVISIGHTNVLSSAQTTQGLYRIAIDKNGHISGYSAEVTSLPASDVYDWAKASTKPSYNFSEIGSKPNSLNGYGITNAYTKTEVDNLLAGLPEPMIFKGSLGSGGTITSLPTASADNEGFTYKVITAGTYASQSAKVGDTFISDGSAWVLIPSGDEPSGTVTSITLTQGTGISIADSGVAITSSGSRTISLATITKNNSTSTASPSHGETFTTIDTVTYDNYGRVTGVNTKTVTLPSDSDQKVYQQASTSSTAQPIIFRNNVSSSTGSTTDGVRYVNTVTVTPSTGNIKATTFNGYTLNNASAKDVDSSIGAGSTSTKLPTSEAVAAFVEGKGYITSADVPEGASAYTGTISAVGTTANVGSNNGFARGDHVHNITKTTIDAVLGTGTNTEKFYREDGSWQVPAYLTIGNTATTAAAGNHTHTTTIATSNGTNQLTLNANTKYAITAGGTSYIFTTPTDTNTHRPIQLKGIEILGNNTTALNFAQGDNITLSNSSGTITIAATDTTYESKAAASNGTAVSLVTTGEKYTWNNKQNALTNPVTGTGTSNKLVVWNGTTTVTSGPQIFVDTDAPTSNDGSNGDIWFTYTA